MDRIDLMKTYIQVAETSSFTAAADRLGMTPQLASKYVRALEEELKVQLFNRSTRRVSMTETGYAFYDRCVRLVEDFEELSADVRKDHREPRGELRMTAPHCFGGKYLLDALADFSIEFPEISAQIDLTDRYVDLLEESLDLAVRIGDMGDSSLFAKQIGSVAIVACTSPNYLSDAPDLQHPEDLKNHICIIDTNFRAKNKWAFEIDGMLQTIDIEGQFKVNSASGARSLALKDKGVFLTPEYMVCADFEAGRLVPVLSAYTKIKLGIHIVYPPTKHLSAKVRHFIDFTAERFRYMR
jgi:DNA-binding transcriptional LysR family regulator